MVSGSQDDTSLASVYDVSSSNYCQAPFHEAINRDSVGGKFSWHLYNYCISITAQNEIEVLLQQQ